MQAVDNRSAFPLSGGFVTLSSGHPNWNRTSDYRNVLDSFYHNLIRMIVGILLSTVQDPTSFDNFTNSSGQQQFVRNFASSPTPGNYCIPLDLSNTGVSGVADGANVTIQLVYNAGDGSLYQVRLRAAFPSSLCLHLTKLSSVLGLDTFEHLYRPIQCLLLQFLLYHFGKFNSDRHEWCKRNLHVGLCWRAWLPDSLDYDLSGAG